MCTIAWKKSERRWDLIYWFRPCNEAKDQLIVWSVIIMSMWYPFTLQGNQFLTWKFSGKYHLLLHGRKKWPKSYYWEEAPSAMPDRGFVRHFAAIVGRVTHWNFSTICLPSTWHERNAASISFRDSKLSSAGEYHPIMKSTTFPLLNVVFLLGVSFDEHRLEYTCKVGGTDNPKYPK